MALEILKNNNEINDFLLNREIDIIDLGKKSIIKNNTNHIIFMIPINLVNSRKKLRSIIKKILKLQKQCFKKNINIGATVEGREMLGIIINKNDEAIDKNNLRELEVIINLSKIKDEKARIEYVYDEACDYLDSECRRLNYCDFKDDVCIAKRNPSRGKEIKMGCCYHIKMFKSNKNKKMCEYMQDRHCTTKCFACKLFTCDAVKEKYRIKDMASVDCFFNPVQKLILRVSILTPKEKIINRLLIT